MLPALTSVGALKLAVGATLLTTTVALNWATTACAGSRIRPRTLSVPSSAGVQLALRLLPAGPKAPVPQSKA